MALIGELTVNVVAKTRKFNGKMKEARGAVARFSKGVQTATKSLGAFGGTLAAVTSAGAFAAFTKNVIDAGDRLGKTSELLGISTQRLAGLQLAADRTGVATRQLETGLQRFGRRVSQAADGTGEAQDAITELGLSAQRLEQLGLASAFARVADAIQKIENPLDRVRIAQKLFDSEGVALVRTLNLTSEGLRELEEEAKAVGLAFSKDQTDRMARFNDELSRAADLFKGLVATGITPAVQVLGDLLGIVNQISRRLGGGNDVLGLLTAFGGGTAIEFAVRQRIEEIRARRRQVERHLDEERSRLTGERERRDRVRSVASFVQDPTQALRDSPLRDFFGRVQGRLQQENVARRVERQRAFAGGVTEVGRRIGGGIPNLAIGSSIGEAIAQALASDRGAGGAGGIALKGTQEAFRKIADIRRQDKMERIQQKQLTTQEQSKTVLERIADGVSGISEFSFGAS